MRIIKNQSLLLLLSLGDHGIGEVKTDLKLKTEKQSGATCYWKRKEKKKEIVKYMGITSRLHSLT